MKYQKKKTFPTPFSGSGRETGLGGERGQGPAVFQALEAMERPLVMNSLVQWDVCPSIINSQDIPICLRMRIDGNERAIPELPHSLNRLSQK